jgi:hypothetical protein
LDRRGDADRLELRFALWTSRAVRELIERRLERRLGPSTVQLHLKRWGMTPQKAAGAGQGARAGCDRGVAGGHLSGDRQAGQGGSATPPEVPGIALGN